MNFSRHQETEDFVHFSRFPGLNGLEVMSARWVKHSFRPHAHDFYTVSLNYGGGGAFDCRGQSREAKPGTCNLMAPGELHTGHATCEVGWIYRNLYIEPTLMKTMLQGLDYAGPTHFSFRAPVTQDKVLAERLAHAFSSLEASSSLLENESSLLAVVARLIMDHVAPSHTLRHPGWEHPAVRRAQEWLDAHFEKNVSLSTLANLAGLSPYYFVRAFHKHLGVPPHRYQTIVRVNQARTLLLSGRPISEVAYRAGFCDQSHLNRCFKSMFGVTPGKYTASGHYRGSDSSTLQ